MKCCAKFFLFFQRKYLFQQAFSPKDGKLSGAQFLHWTSVVSVHVQALFFPCAHLSSPVIFKCPSRDSASKFILLPSFVRTIVSADTVQYLNLDFDFSFIDLSSELLLCKSLRVLKLHSVTFKTLTNLPWLKVLHLHDVEILNDNLFQILSACPVLEDLEMENVCGLFPGHHKRKYKVHAEVKPLPNLVRAVIEKDVLPLKAVENVQFLAINIKAVHREINDPIPVFHNLTRLEVNNNSHDDDLTILLRYVFEVVKHCPKLQSLSIDLESDERVTNIDDGLFSQCVPTCISSHLKTCILNNYTGTPHSEFQFAKYIRENARFLKDMIICCDPNRQGNSFDMLKELSFCSRLSSICNLSFRLW